MATKTNTRNSRNGNGKVDTPISDTPIETAPVEGPQTLEALVSDAGGWEDLSSRSHRDWDSLTDGKVHSETFTGGDKDSRARKVAAFKSQLKKQSEKVERSYKVKVLDKSSDAPMVVFQFVK